ncbi:DEAD/DEAH box helicase family protein [Methyloceanibacter sp. wino2]|uniref:DEAD/DEAH box helicase family protein n=1 Tax=Methyloceanibacter sp. wino2 TaxID=2170729 RepID=UPI000D3ED7C1|nr:DEAD/DEAH box helicase family protein [Methyloceanibacter sp. wino2]
MILDFGKLQKGISATKPLEPRKIFSTLNRKPRFKRPHDEQSDVLDSWFKKREQRNNTVKMNTGSGKTLVGLLTLQSSLNEGIAPAVYVTPDKYLTKQVLEEAEDLGINATASENDPAFLKGEAILVVNVWKLINAKSVFGVGDEGVKIPIGALVVDDAHACLATVAKQFSLRLEATHPAYKELLKLFRDDLKAQSLIGFLDLESGDPRALMAVPFWAWKDRQIDVARILHPHRNEDEFKWAWPLIGSVLPLCQCIFGGKELEIAPRYLPVDTIPAFTGAKRRVYMTATLADDGILVSHFQADATEVSDPVRPKGGGDIGDRMILAPQEINPEIEIDDVKALAVKLAKKKNVAVIVPSGRRAKYWKDVAAQVLDSNNIATGVEKMRAGHVGLTVLINKYDGIDLPDQSCEVLVLDGLPEVYGLAERIEMAALDGTEVQLLRQVQRLEQGMGRGVRSSEDYCAVLLLGAKLTHRIHLPAARSKFTPATRAQLDLGRQVTEQVRGKPIKELKDIVDLCLDRDKDWVETSRSAVVNAQDDVDGHIDPAIVELRAAFDAARSGNYKAACEHAQKAVNSATQAETKAYYKQQLAEYMHHLDPAKAQEIQLSAVEANRRLTKPIAGIGYTKLEAPAAGQAQAATLYMSKFLEGNDLLVWVNGILEELTWEDENSKEFEAAVRDLGAFFGFGSQRPEQEIGKGPDNLWALGELRYLIIECKSGATSPQISKADCNQLIGSVSWFKNTYDPACTGVPVIIHPSKTFQKDAAPLPEMRVVDEDRLEKFKDTVRKYAIALSNGKAYKDKAQVKDLLVHFELTGAQIIQTMTVAYKHKQ